MKIPKHFIPNKKSSMEDLLSKKSKGEAIELTDIDRIMYSEGASTYIIDWEEDQWKLYEKEGVRWYPADMDEKALKMLKEELNPVAKKLGLFLEEDKLHCTNVRTLVEKVAKKVCVESERLIKSVDVVEVKERYRAYNDIDIILCSYVKI